MSTKLKIDLSQGLLEVEGSEAFVRNIYADFKTHFAGVEDEVEAEKATARTRKAKVSPAKRINAKKNAPAEANSPPAKTPADEPATPAAEPEPPEEPGPPVEPKPAPPTYIYLTDLDLKANKTHPALVEFMDSKFPITNEERNIVFIYYLQHLLNLKDITVDHIYTCFREAKIRAPLNIQKTLIHDDWVKVAKNGTLSLSAAGKKYVEQNLPKKLKY